MIGIERRGRLGGQCICLRAICAASAALADRSGTWSGAARSVVGSSALSSRSSSGLRSSSSSTKLADLDIRVLQQLDRLTQLRRHDQCLGLAQIEAWAYRHDSAMVRSSAVDRRC